MRPRQIPVAGTFTACGSTFNVAGLASFSGGLSVTLGTLLVESTGFPRHALSSLIEDEKDIVGGWYNLVNEPQRWASGWYDDDQGIFTNAPAPCPGLVEVDMVGLGCILLSRKAYQDIEFKTGLNTLCTLADGRQCPIGTCAQFGLDAQAKGFKLHMDGSVVCDHLSRPPGYG